MNFFGPVDAKKLGCDKQIDIQTDKQTPESMVQLVPFELRNPKRHLICENLERNVFTQGMSQEKDKSNNP